MLWITKKNQPRNRQKNTHTKTFSKHIENFVHVSGVWRYAWHQSVFTEQAVKSVDVDREHFKGLSLSFQCSLYLCRDLMFTKIKSMEKGKRKRNKFFLCYLHWWKSFWLVRALWLFQFSKTYRKLWKFEKKHSFYANIHVSLVNFTLPGWEKNAPSHFNL